MTDQDQDQDQDATKMGLERTDDETDVEGHSSDAARAGDGADDVEGHFGSIRPTGRKGE